MSPAYAVSHPWPEDDEWKESAACRSMAPGIFYPVPVGNTARRWVGRSPDPYAEARAVCGSCPVSGECLTFGLAIRDQEGMFGGKDPHERELILRQRRNR